ncbi:SdrD B-like domain-containing protein [Micromonospora globbae]|uniref:SdrD B-like domain-containing protein n=1 Tax=Micromonospora globbae TaxID=1894969 RepID=UPI0034255F72
MSLHQQRRLKLLGALAGSASIVTSIGRPSRRALRTGCALLALSGMVAAVAPASPALAGPRRADVAVTLTASPTEVTATGGATIATVEVRNVGTDAASDVTVTFTLPLGAGMATEPPYFAEWRCDVSTAPTWTCIHGPLAAGAAAESLRFDLYLPGGAHGEAVTIGAAATTSSRELTTTNNTDQVTVHYAAADLAIGMTAIPEEVIVGGEVILTLNVQNIGAGETTGAFQLDVYLPDTMTPTAGFPQGDWDCQVLLNPAPGFGDYYCVHRGPIRPGQVLEPAWLRARVDSGTPGETQTATATVRPVDGEVSTANNTAQASVAVVEPGTIRGSLWIDQDRDGQRDSDEPATAGVRTLLFLPQAPVDGDPTEITAVLNPDGTYSAALKPGPYIVQVQIESQYLDFTLPDVGDDATDSDIVTVQRDIYGGIDAGNSAVIDVTAGSDTTIDVGFIDLTS